MLRELSQVFLNECPGLMMEIREAIAGHDGPQLQRAAHTLKSSMRLFAAATAHDLCWELETMAKHDRSVGADPKLTRLEHEINRVSRVLRHFVERG